MRHVVSGFPNETGPSRSCSEFTLCPALLTSIRITVMVRLGPKMLGSWSGYLGPVDVVSGAIVTCQGQPTGGRTCWLLCVVGYGVRMLHGEADPPRRVCSGGVLW